MKMKVGTRIVFSILMLAIIGVCALIITAALGYIAPQNIEMLYNGFIFGGYSYIWAIAAA